LRALAAAGSRVLTVVFHLVVSLSIFVSGLGVPPWIQIPGLVLWAAGVWLIVRWWLPHPMRLLLVPAAVGVSYWTVVVTLDALRLLGPA
jgi:hypothetical protein